MTPQTKGITMEQIKETWIIQDWAGNTCFQGKEFKSFEDGWGFIYETIDDEACYEDYYVETREST